MLYIALNNSSVQNYIAQTIVKNISDKLHTRVSLNHIEYQLFNTISIQGLYVEDLDKDSLLYIGNLKANFSLWKIINANIDITSVELDHLAANLKVNKKGESNIDFIIKAFSTPPTKDSSKVEYHIKRLKINNSSLKYTNLKRLERVPENMFNANKVDIQNFNLSLTFDFSKNDSISLSVDRFNAKEKSGLVISELITRVNASKRGLTIPYFSLKLPNSVVQFDSIQLKIDSLADLKKFATKAKFRAPIASSHIKLSDLKAFVPVFEKLDDIASIKGELKGTVSNLRLKKFELKYGKSMLFNADVDINGLPVLDDAFIYCNINDLHFQKNDIQDFVADLAQKPVILPKELNNLGLIRYKGNISGFLSNLVAYGNLSTGMGSITTDLMIGLENNLKDLTYNGTLKSAHFKLGHLLNNPEIGNISFKLNTKGKKLHKSAFKGSINAHISQFEFKKYKYNDISFIGDYNGNGFDGKADIKDENIDAQFNGMIDMKNKLPVFNFELALSHLNIHNLNLTPKYTGSSLSFQAKTNMTGNSLENLNGFLAVENLIFTNKDKVLAIPEIKINSRSEGDFTNFNITSEIINGHLTGNFNYGTIERTVNSFLVYYLPTISGGSEKLSNNSTPNLINLNFEIENTKKITDILDIPYTIEGSSYLKGYIDERNRKVELVGNIPLVKSGKTTIKDIALHIENPKQLQITTRAKILDNNTLINLFLIASAAKDSIKTHLGWQSGQKVTNAGDLITSTNFKKTDGKLSASMKILPTQIIILDSIWKIQSSRIDFNSDSTIAIHNFRFGNINQFLTIDGIASKHKEDGISVEMKDLNLDYIMTLVRLKGVSLGGMVTGKANLTSLFSQPIFEANLSVADFTLNHKWIGNGKVNSFWNKDLNQLIASGTFKNKQNDTIVVAHANYVPKRDSISVTYDARNLSISFLDTWLSSVVQNIDGTISGKVRMFGPLKQGVQFEGDGYLRNAQFSVKTLGTKYYINDSVHMRTNSIEFRNIRATDQERNPASVTAVVHHNGYFQNMTYNAVIKSKNILGMNIKQSDNDYFYGKAYANGTVNIFGNDKEANIWVNAKAQPHTECFIQMGGAAKAADNSFIKFVNKKRLSQYAPVQTSANPKTDFNVKVNLQLEVTPDADLKLIINPKAGDMITGKGSGNLMVEFDSHSDLKLSGTYEIDNGYYLFTLQNVIRRDFKIDRGSTITWASDPFDAQVNIRALYSLTASLKDLMDADQLNSMTRTSVPVNCVLKLSESLTKPAINFDIELPSSDEGVKQQVRNIVNTEEMMNRQILYLLTLNKFYKPEYMSNSSNASTNMTNQALSIAASTLSGQMNSWLSQMIENDNLSIGFDWRKSDETFNEYQAQIVYQPNNRWLVNGNFGYRDDISLNNKFIGDIDLEYMLTEGGKFRLKGYNHTVNRYQLKTNAKTTQGFGFMYKEEFVNVDELMNYYFKLLIGKNKKK